jgi:pimeloyl-[acyl-carrier protein] methyl ester esterase
MPELYVETCGRGPDVVLLHGWALNLRVFDRLAQALAAHFRVTRLDLPGHGRSGGAFDAATLDRLKSMLPERSCVLGWSLGGQFALQLAAAAPERIAALVLVTTTPRFVAHEGWSCGMPVDVFDQFQTRLAHDLAGTVRDFLALQVRGTHGAAATLRELQSALAQHGQPQPDALASGLALLRDNDLRGLVAPLPQRVLVIAGRHDRITDPAAGRWLAREMPRARFIELAGGHAPFLSHADEFLGAVAPFLHERAAAIAP